VELMDDGKADRRAAWAHDLVVVLAACWEKVPLTLATALFLGAVVCGTADGAACENEALRSELGSSALPECRAYEMVSPPYKGGQPLFVAGFAADGESAILHSLAGIAGTPGSSEAVTESNWYLASRAVDGWHLSPMNPPLGEFVGQLPDAQEADTGLSLWTQHTPHQSSDTAELYIRSAAGEYAVVGTLSPKAVGAEASDFIQGANLLIDDQPIAATSTYQHVVIRAAHPEAHWSFDQTVGEESLYEYSGIDNTQPVLVAALGSKKGSEELIEPCGATLGSGVQGSAYNALSRDGETIFFTSEPCLGKPAEVYARSHGAVDSPGAAELIDVGESECNVECGVVESGRNFEGASEDGSKVFFTSTQKLTNDASDLTAGGNATEGEGCAGSTSGCNLYEYDFSSPAHQRLTLVAGGVDDVRGVAGIAEGGSRVYFVANGEAPNSGENKFHRKPSGGKPNLYVYDTDTGTTTFVTTLGEGEEEARDWGRGFSRPIEVAGESGRFLLFVSAAVGITPDDTSKEGVSQLFEYDAQTDELVRVTQGEEGYDENGDGVERGISVESIAGRASTLGELRDFKSATNPLNIARDGKRVVFRTKGALSERATSASAAGCASVYEFSSEGGAISEGKVRLLSDGHDTQLYQGVECGAKFQAIDEGGSNVLIFTSDPLLTSDVDGVQPDIYDVRVGGGFPPGPAQGESASCAGGRCQGSGQGSVGVNMAPSVAEGNFKPQASGGGSKQAKSVNRAGSKHALGPRACARNKQRRRAPCGVHRGKMARRVGKRPRRSV
jgi:hypothetical protein